MARMMPIWRLRSTTVRRAMTPRAAMPTTRPRDMKPWKRYWKLAGDAGLLIDDFADGLGLDAAFDEGRFDVVGHALCGGIGRIFCDDKVVLEDTAVFGEGGEVGVMGVDGVELEDGAGHLRLEDGDDAEAQGAPGGGVPDGDGDGVPRFITEDGGAVLHAEEVLAVSAEAVVGADDVAGGDGDGRVGTEGLEDRFIAGVAAGALSEGQASEVEEAGVDLGELVGGGCGVGRTGGRRLRRCRGRASALCRCRPLVRRRRSRRRGGWRGDRRWGWEGLPLTTTSNPPVEFSLVKSWVKLWLRKDMTMRLKTTRANMARVMPVRKRWAMG